MRKRSKCWWTSQHAGGPVNVESVKILPVEFSRSGRGGGELHTSKASGKTDSAVGRLDLDEERAQDVDAPARSRVAVLLPLRARGGNRAVD